MLKSGLASSVEEAQKVAQSLQGDSWVVKAQVSCRGKRKRAGGIQLTKSIQEV